MQHLDDSRIIFSFINLSKHITLPVLQLRISQNDCFYYFSYKSHNNI